jgi:CheY-like chemotaxis protein
MVPPLTVLHVDDDPEFLALSRESFRRASGFEVEVVTAASAAAGVAAMESRRVDCVVSDSLTLSDGTPFVAAARRADPDVPIVLFSARAWREVSDDAEAAGVETHVRKADHADIERVIDAVESVARRTRRAEADRSVGRPPADRPSDASPVGEIDGDEWEFVTAHDWATDGELVTTIAVALASHTGVAATDVEPLFRTVDADALEAIVKPPRGADSEFGVCVRFSNESWEFAVSSRGEVALRAADGSSD